MEANINEILTYRYVNVYYKMHVGILIACKCHLDHRNSFDLQIDLTLKQAGLNNGKFF